MRLLRERGYTHARAGGAQAFDPAKDEPLTMPQAFDGKPDSTLEQFKAEQEIRVEQLRQQAQQAQFEAQKSIELAANRDAENHRFELDQMRAEMDSRMDQLRSQVDILIAQLNNAAKIEVAEIGAQATLDAGQMAAANAASGEENG